jgi:hypothetical protein
VKPAAGHGLRRRLENTDIIMRSDARFGDSPLLAILPSLQVSQPLFDAVVVQDAYDSATTGALDNE